MGKRFKDIAYKQAQTYVKNKDYALRNFLENAFNKTVGMFHYKGLPETIPASEFEKLLQLKGHCIIIEEKGGLYAVNGGFSGEVDVYENPTQYTISNVGLNISKTYTIDKDCILCKNDFNCSGLLPLFEKYGVLMVDTDISLNMAAILLRIPMLISAPDDKTKASAELFLSKVLDGDFSIVGDNAFFDGVKMQSTTNNNSNYITQFIEQMQYYKASFLNEIGLQANYNMKRERLSESEAALNIDAILPLIDAMYTERVNAVEKINAMFGTEIVVDYNSAWKATHEENEHETAIADTTTNTDCMENNNVDNFVENVDNFLDREETEETATETETETETETDDETETETDETETETDGEKDDEEN